MRVNVDENVRIKDVEGVDVFDAVTLVVLV